MDNQSAGMPRWVKVSIAVTVAIVVLFVALLLAGQSHGPGRHSSDGLAAPSVGAESRWR